MESILELVEPSQWRVRVRHSPLPLKAAVVTAIDADAARRTFADRLPQGSVTADMVLEVEKVS